MNRDLDAQIAKLIFNWQYIPIGPDYDGKNQCQILYPPGPKPDQDFYNCLPRVGKIHEGWYAPTYTRDLIEAIKLAKHVGLKMCISEMPTDAECLSKAALDWWLNLTKPSS